MQEINSPIPPFDVDLAAIEASFRMVSIQIKTSAIQARFQARLTQMQSQMRIHT